MTKKADAVNWAALRPGDPDPEPLANGDKCEVFVKKGRLQFDCTRAPHGDPFHVSCAWWPPFGAEDSIVIATWLDPLFGARARDVRVLDRNHPMLKGVRP